MMVAGQTSKRVLTIIEYHQLSSTIMRRLTRALQSRLPRRLFRVFPWPKLRPRFVNGQLPRFPKCEFAVVSRVKSIKRYSTFRCIQHL